MPARFALLGTKQTNIADVARSVGDALGRTLSLRESSYRGGEYFFNRDSDGTELSVEQNVRDEEGQYVEPEYSHYRVLVYVNYGNSAIERKVADIPGLHFLRVETV
ncbi:hypothetical protein [Streptomyces collinus]|uniref:Uncharacterized protein n=1 Tax=Streptomyces collinus TaxID=42684 RepID=A0AA89U2L6_STRCU|nr:hypothetical protein [Streptomyces collinus]MBB5816898.1 hypothetical protein [Streptomyces collinus]WMX61871.1 hypothetical protein RFN52_00200 [Streptomyces collinus]